MLKGEIMEESSATTTLETKLDLSKCQACQRSFKSLLGHLNNSRNTEGCKDNYTSEEIAYLEYLSKEADKIWHHNRHKASYDPVKRAKKYKQRFIASTSHVVKEEINPNHICKGCDVTYKSILSHLHQSKDCKDKYSSEELDKIRKWVKEWTRHKANDNRRRKYKDHEKQKRADKYHQTPYNAEKRKEKYEDEKDFKNLKKGVGIWSLEYARKASIEEWGKWKQYYNLFKEDLSDDRKYKELEEESEDIVLRIDNAIDKIESEIKRMKMNEDDACTFVKTEIKMLLKDKERGLYLAFSHHNHNPVFTLWHDFSAKTTKEIMSLVKK